MQTSLTTLGPYAACSVSLYPQQLITSPIPSGQSSTTSFALTRHQSQPTTSSPLHAPRAASNRLYRRLQCPGMPSQYQDSLRTLASARKQNGQVTLAMARNGHQSERGSIGFGHVPQTSEELREEVRQEASDDMVRKAFASAPFANLSSSSQPASPPPPQTSTGSPLLWVGVGVALCVVVTRAANWLKARVMKLAMEQMMKQMGGGGAGSPFGAGGFPSPPGFPPSQSPFPSPFPPPPASPSSNTASPPFDTTVSTPASSSAKKSSSKKSAVVDVEATVAAEPMASSTATSAEAPTEEEKKKEPKKKFFQDAEVVEDPANPWTGWSGYTNNTAQSNGNGNGAGQSSQGTGPAISVEQLEKMLESPMIQNMILQYMPEEMRSPESLKWMLQNPIMRKQLEEQMATLAQGEWGSQMGELLNTYDLSSPDLMKQYEDMGVTPEQAVKTIMANPDLAQAFQSPKIQAALLDCAKNPMNQMKYVNDREVMDVFEKISKLFPQAGGP